MKSLANMTDAQIAEHVRTAGAEIEQLVGMGDNTDNTADVTASRCYLAALAKGLVLGLELVVAALEEATK